MKKAAVAPPMAQPRKATKAIPGATIGSWFWEMQHVRTHGSARKKERNKGRCEGAWEIAHQLVVDEFAQPSNAALFGDGVHLQQTITRRTLRETRAVWERLKLTGSTWQLSEIASLKLFQTLM